MKESQTIIITETPRDAMQGLTKIIATKDKVQYINLLLKCGFETVDIGSFVSPKAVPQMADTAQVLSLLEKENSSSKLMVLAGNSLGGTQAAAIDKIQTISYPYSVSGTFLKRNLNTTPEKAWETVLDIKNICEHLQKEFRVYVTMAFGNPYGDVYNDEIVIREVEKLYAEGIRDLVFSDVTGEGPPGTIERLCSIFVYSFPDAKLGIHLHTKPNDWQEKVEAAWVAGLRYFEGVIGGFGGCPMTGYELLGNLDTYKLINWCKTNGIETGIDENHLFEARKFASMVLK